VIGRECGHALHLVPEFKNGQNFFINLNGEHREKFIFVGKKSLQQFHTENKRVVIYLAAILVRSFTYIGRDINFN
jgi:hypothetical protein